VGIPALNGPRVAAEPDRLGRDLVDQVRDQDAEIVAGYRQG